MISRIVCFCCWPKSLSDRLETKVVACQCESLARPTKLCASPKCCTSLSQWRVASTVRARTLLERITDTASDRAVYTLRRLWRDCGPSVFTCIKPQYVGLYNAPKHKPKAGLLQTPGALSHIWQVKLSPRLLSLSSFVTLCMGSSGCARAQTTIAVCTLEYSQVCECRQHD